MGLDVRSWDYWRINQIYAGRDPYNCQRPDWIVPDLLRTGLWMWRDEF